MSGAVSLPTSSDQLLADAQAIGKADLVYAARQSQSWTWQQAAVSSVLAVTDMLAFCVAIAAGALAAQALNVLLASDFDAFADPDLSSHLLLWACVVAAVCIWYGWAGHYTLRRSFEDDLKSILGPLFIGLMVNGFLQFAMKATFSRLWLVCGWALAVVTLPLGRIVARRLMDAAGLWRRNVLVLGSGPHLVAIGKSLSFRYLGYTVAFGGGVPEDKQSAAKLLNDLGAGLDGPVILAPSDDEFEHLENLVDGLNTRMISYAVVPPFQKLPLANLSVRTFINSDAVLLTVGNGLASPVSQAFKRIFDAAVSLFLLMLLSPIFLIVAGLVALDGGPVFFAHERIGRGGRVFRCLKFRSMVPNAAEVLELHLAKNEAARDEWARSHKLKNDPRKTWIGGMLRSTSLDELPQLVNVLRGDMSLVGPRPVIQEELLRHYGANNAYYLMVRPGITGLWQVSGRSDTGYSERVYLDAWYVRNWSMWNDIMLLCRTIPVVITGRGAF